MSRKISGVVAGLLSMAWMSSALADDIPRCPLLHDVKQLDFYFVPAAFRSALNDKIGSMAMPGENFDATDLRVTGQNRRLIFIRARGRRWVVATERGGRVYSDPIFVFDVDLERNTVNFVAEEGAFPSTVCATAAQLLNAEN